MSPTVARPPHSNSLVIYLGEGCGKGDRMAIVTDLCPGIDLLLGEAIAGPKIAMVIDQCGETGVGECFGKEVKVELFHCRPTMGHHHQGEGHYPLLREIQPATQGGPLRIKRDICSHSMLLFHSLCCELSFLTLHVSELCDDRQTIEGRSERSTSTPDVRLKDQPLIARAEPQSAPGLTRSGWIESIWSYSSCAVVVVSASRSKSRMYCRVSSMIPGPSSVPALLCPAITARGLSEEMVSSAAIHSRRGCAFCFARERWALL